jgi:hypothetical protein
MTMVPSRVRVYASRPLSAEPQGVWVSNGLS